MCCHIHYAYTTCVGIVEEKKNNNRLIVRDTHLGGCPKRITFRGSLFFVFTKNDLFENRKVVVNEKNLSWRSETWNSLLYLIHLSILDFHSI
jgi:hypothetical protein